MKPIGPFDVVFLIILPKYHVYIKLSMFGHARSEFISLINDLFEPNSSDVKRKPVNTI